MGVPYLAGGRPGLGIEGPFVGRPKPGLDCMNDVHSVFVSVGVGVGALLP